MENDTLVEQVTETVQDTSAVNSMVEGVKKLVDFMKKFEAENA